MPRSRSAPGARAVGLATTAAALAGVTILACSDSTAPDQSGTFSGPATRHVAHRPRDKMPARSPPPHQSAGEVWAGYGENVSKLSMGQGGSCESWVVSRES
jgi:hypothetical protein